MVAFTVSPGETTDLSSVSGDTTTNVLALRSSAAIDTGSPDGEPQAPAVAPRSVAAARKRNIVVFAFGFVATRIGSLPGLRSAPVAEAAPL
jgi:hypothetical protein